MIKKPNSKQRKKEARFSSFSFMNLFTMRMNNPKKRLGREEAKKSKPAKIKHNRT